MNKVKNKACPFCGDGVIKAQALMIKNYPAGYNAMCDNCESTGPYAETPEGALEKWNSRAGGEQPKAVQNSEAKGQFAPSTGSAHWRDEYDWPCDTYQYQNRCALCAVHFIGDKRRVVCRKCASSANNLPPLNAPNDEFRRTAPPLKP